MYLRTARITILNPEGDLIVIEPPFSIHALVVRNTMATANTLSLTILNLSEKTRSKLFKDRFTFTLYWRIIVEAGYEDEGINIIFSGNIQECYSYKIGNKWETKIEAYDGMYGIQNGFTSETFSKNTDLKTILERAVKDMPNILQGLFGENAEGSIPRGYVAMGNSSDIIDELTKKGYYIDNEKLNVLADYEYFGETKLILDSSRLISTPKRRDVFLDCEAIFFPKATIGYLVEVDSKQEEFNGDYVMIGIKHDLTISEAEVGRAISTLELSAGSSALRKANP